MCGNCATGGPGSHPLPWQSKYYNEHLSPRIPRALAGEYRRGGMQSIRKLGVAGTGNSRSDAPVRGRQDFLRLTRIVIDGKPKRRP